MPASNALSTVREDALLTMKDLKVWYPVRKLLTTTGYVKAVDGVTISIKRGEIYAIVGESGCGKT
ncbi:MAG: ATP-binding cassette domain-containing protein, partial [Zestosphaera sp.]